MLEDATRERQMSVAQGAASRTNPQWCGASLSQTWAVARLGAMQGRISEKNFDRVDAIVYELISETLSPQELACITGKA